MLKKQWQISIAEVNKGVKKSLITPKMLFLLRYYLASYNLVCLSLLYGVQTYLKATL